jgi:hypothetical protein
MLSSSIVIMIVEKSEKVKSRELKSKFLREARLVDGEKTFVEMFVRGASSAVFKKEGRGPVRGCRTVAGAVGW